MYTKRKIIHIDMDAFYASVEQKDNPRYRGKPLIVGGRPKSRGVVAACSYEARVFGIHSAMPCSMAARLCSQAVFVRPRIHRYKEVSLKIMKIFRQYTDLVEPLSLDEAFLDVTVNNTNNPSATLVAEQIRRQIFRETGLTASAGVSYNKFLAKVASDVHKPNGITTIPPEHAMDFLSSLPIGKFFGVGKVTEKKMTDLGIKNGSDLRSWDREKLIIHFGKTGSFLSDIVRGIDNRPVQPNRIRKSVGSETTLRQDIREIERVLDILSAIAEKIERSLLKLQTGGYTVTLKIRYSDFTTITRSRTLKNPIFSKSDILHCLPELLRMTEAGTRDVRLLGISISNLTLNKGNRPHQLLLPFP
ncbi:DNA polymerase IV [Desulfomarina profundi]|uniref:DNA polymerase IV n=1 Tax=Desulfomarina profundi TaxID=2772557 RepID=A0A8D5FHC8_9BACT|nr:DNA polymerase IV [Desulfomarina profundi]BCL60685.1 DNA polymerase IV [Desulfomarina profundi]